MRPRRTLTPTARLVRLILAGAVKPLTYIDLAVASGCSVDALQTALPALVSDGLVSRTVLAGIAHFALGPANVNAVTTSTTEEVK